MAHAEELRLTVSVDDQATAQLQGLRGQLTSMGSGAPAAGMERVRRQSVEVGRGFAGLSQELSQFATRAGAIGGVVGALSNKVIELGSNFLNRVTDVKGYSDAIVTLNRNATLSGVSMAQFQSITNTMQQSGLSFEEATAHANKFGEALVDIQRANSPTRRRLIAEAPDAESQRNMTALLDRMRESSPAAAANMWLDAAAGVRKYWEARGQGAKGAQAERAMLAEMNLPYMAERRFAVPTKEEEALIAARLKGAQETAAATNETKTAWAEMATSAASILNMAIPFGTHMRGVRDDVKAGAEFMKSWEASIIKAGGVLPWFKAQLPGWMRGETAPDTRPTAAPGEKPTERDLEERRRKFREDEERRRRELLNIPPGGQEPPPPGLQPRGPSAPVARPPGSPAPSRFGPRPPVVTAPATPETTPAAPEATLATPETPSTTVMDEAANAAAAEAARRATAEAQDAARQAAAAERRRQAARGWTGTAPPPAPAPAPPPGPQPAPAAALQQVQFVGGPQPPAITQPQPQPAAPAGPEPQAAEGRAYDVSAIGDLLKAIQAGGITVPSTDFAGTGWRGLPLSRNVVDERGQPPATPPAITVTPPPAAVVVSPPPQPQPIVVPFGDLPQQPQPQPATVEPSRGRELAPVDTGRAPPPSAFEGGRIGMMGGAGMDLGQAGQALDARMLDQAAARDVNVNGSGKISVDVRAPAGTRVAAQGEGLFKTVTIARQTQMFPAESGPIPETGIGAAQGQLG